MPKRIPFHVVYATSEDSQYPACELNSQGPEARGWRSAGGGPHELLLRLDSVATVERLQLLAHHQLIPAWVEVLVSGGLTAGGAATPCGALYASVGRVSLARAAPGGRSRELRSALLPQPTSCRFVKLRISAPHDAAAGDEQQVSLMAVNILGEDPEGAPRESPTLFGDCMCPYDDLSFVMYVDTEIADMIRSLDGRKKYAVAEERFEYARRLKSAGIALAAAGVRVGRWRLKKRTAAAREDFEQAKQMRDRIADALYGIKTDPELSRLFEENGSNPRNDEPMLHPYDLARHLSPSLCVLEPASPVPIDPDRDASRDDDVMEATEPPPPPKSPVKEMIQVQEVYVEEERLEVRTEEVPVKHKPEDEQLRTETDSPRRSITPNSANGVRRRNKSAGPRTTFEAYEERPLPALRHSQTNEFLRESTQDDGGSGSGAAPARAHKLNERERKHAALPILIFGYPLVEKFYSKNYFDKEEGLSRLKSELLTPSAGNKSSPNKCARAASTLLQRSLRDKVYSVYCQANELVRALFQDFMKDNKVCAAEVGRCVDKLLPELLRACGDPAPRVHATAQHTVLTLADSPHVRSLHLIPQQLVRPVAAAMHPRLALSRLQMLEQLLLTHGISTDKNSGLTVRRLAECGAAGAQHASGAVRAAAERILLAAYRRSPRVVRAQLPPDDAVTRRNLLYRHLFQQLDRIDTEKLLSQAPSEDQLADQSLLYSTLETSSMCYSTRSGTTSGMTSSFGTSTYSLKSAASGSTLAASSLGGSSKSSLKKSPRKYTPTKCRDLSIGYNKLRLDSAVSPKHSPKTPSSSEKVHFEDNPDKVVFRKANRNTENRHSMIHFDHDTTRPFIRDRPVTVYEPLHVEYRDSPTSMSPRTSKHDLRTDSVDSYRSSEPEISRLDSPKSKEIFRDLDSPRMVAGVRNLQLDEGQMDESGYYSPGETGRRLARRSAGEFCEQFDSFDRPVDSSGGTTPEPVCNTACSWCGARVRAGAMESHCARRCVLLARCTHCGVNLEARGLHRHLIEECSLGAGAWRACAECGAALRAEDADYHPNCHPLRMDEWKCPYCLHNVLARDLPWQRHLMQCPRNPRNPRAATQ